MERTHGEYVVSTHVKRLDLDLIHRFLCDESYWARGISRALVDKSVRHSLCFGVYHRDRQVGFARVVTDFSTFGYLMDVFVVRAHRGRGVGKLIMDTIMSHPELQGFRRWLLGTHDAHGLYQQFGFRSEPYPERTMQITRPYPAAGESQGADAHAREAGENKGRGAHPLPRETGEGQGGGAD